MLKCNLFFPSKERCCILLHSIVMYILGWQVNRVSQQSASRQNCSKFANLRFLIFFRIFTVYHSYHNASVYINFRRTRPWALCATIELALILVIHALCLCHLCNLKPHKCHSWPYFATVTFDQVCISVFHCIGNVKLWCNCMYTWFECLIVCLYPHGCIPVNTCTHLPSPKHIPFVQVHNSS